MEQTEFLEQNIFTDLKNLNEGSDKETVHQFSESDFATVLERSEYFGVGIYTIETKLNGEPHTLASHESFKKKATDSRWYNGAFMGIKTRQSDLTYSATYKVSNKLLNRGASKIKQEDQQEETPDPES